MNCAGIEQTDLNPAGTFCLVGYGNPQRRDDGLGPFVVKSLERMLGNRAGIRVFIRHQLEADLVEELREADSIVLVDATLECLTNGWQCTKVESRLDEVPTFTHSVTPGFLVGLLGLLYGREPNTWLVSIQGDDFGFGEGISPQAEARARQVICELTHVVSKEE